MAEIEEQSLQSGNQESIEQSFIEVNENLRKLRDFMLALNDQINGNAKERTDFAPKIETEN